MADVRSIRNTSSGASDEYVEQLRQKIGTGFSDQKATGKKRNEMGKDDFVMLMSAQLKHQDPLSPLKNEQMAAQLAQFSSLEQMVNVNSNLEKMAASQKPQENLLAASLIGKKIVTDSSRFSLTKGTQPELKFDLPDDASQLSVTVVDAKGEVVREYELANMAKGAQSIRWDGKSNKGLDAAAGEYTYRVNANNTQGQMMEIKTSTAGLVSGVTFEGGKALLLVGDKKIPMDAVGRIEADAPGSVGSLAAPKAEAAVSGGAEKITQHEKNSLPPDLSPEKIKSMLGAMGAASRMEADPTAASAGSSDGIAMPLWNPANL